MVMKKYGLPDYADAIERNDVSSVLRDYIKQIDKQKSTEDKRARKTKADSDQKELEITFL